MTRTSEGFRKMTERRVIEIVGVVPNRFIFFSDGSVYKTWWGGGWFVKSSSPFAKYWRKKYLGEQV